jgi:hypothetical protein
MICPPEGFGQVRYVAASTFSEMKAGQFSVYQSGGTSALCMFQVLLRQGHMKQSVAHGLRCEPFSGAEPVFGI